MLLKNAANKVTKLFSKLSPESQLRLHNPDVWDEPHHYANLEMGAMDSLLDADEEAMRYLKEHPNDPKAELVRGMGSNEDLSYLLGHGVSKEEIKANPYFRVADVTNAYTDKEIERFEGPCTCDSFDWTLKNLSGMDKDALENYLQKLEKYDRTRILLDKSNGGIFDDDDFLKSLKKVTSDHALVGSLVVRRSDGSVDTVATHKNVLREAAIRTISQNPGIDFRNGRFVRASGADTDSSNSEYKRRMLMLLKDRYLSEKRHPEESGLSEASLLKRNMSAYRNARLKLRRDLGQYNRYGELTHIANHATSLDHEVSEVRHMLRNAIKFGTTEPRGLMFRKIQPSPLEDEYFFVSSGNHADIGVLADELQHTNSPVYWRGRNLMYSENSENRPYKPRLRSGEQKFLAGLMDIEDMGALGRAVPFPKERYDRIRKASPEKLPKEIADDYNIQLGYTLTK